MSEPDLCRYYSPGWVGSLLIGSVTGGTPTSILDLGCGAGALANAAMQRWSTAPIVTVDIDPSLPSALGISAGRTSNPPRHVVGDVLCHGLGDAIGLPPASVDLVLSNPPYRSTRWRPGFETILKRAGLAEALVAGDDAPTDMIFLAQAMHLVSPGGRVGLIVPDSMISGSRAAKLRRLLLSTLRVERVIQLPRRVFSGTDAQTFVMVMSKNNPTKLVRLDRVDGNGLWAAPILVAPEAAAYRLDYVYHDAGEHQAGAASLRELAVEVRRGAATSVEVEEAMGSIFHTCHFPDRPGGNVRLSGTSLPGRGVFAEPGDILMARVDRRLERKIAFVVAGAGPISDCVFRLRPPAGVAPRLLAGLTSEAGSREIIRLSRGTGARHISISCLMELRV